MEERWNKKNTTQNFKLISPLNFLIATQTVVILFCCCYVCYHCGGVQWFFFNILILFEIPKTFIQLKDFTFNTIYEYGISTIFYWYAVNNICISADNLNDMLKTCICFILFSHTILADKSSYLFSWTCYYNSENCKSCKERLYAKRYIKVQKKL